MLDLNNVVEEKGELVRLLEGIPDPRKRRGIRHSHAVVLAMAIGACLTGARSFLAIGEWVAALPQEALQRFGCRWDDKRKRYIPPSEPTLRRALNAVAVDGRWLHLLSALVHKDGVVVGQRLVSHEHNETTEFKPLLQPMQLDGKVVTADAQHTQPCPEQSERSEHARFLVEEKHADYVFIVKNNQPELLADLEALDQDAFSPSGGNDRQGARTD